MTQGRTGWLCYFDAYGFGNEISTKDNPELILRLREVHAELRSSLAKTDAIGFFLSDSFIIFVPCDKQQKIETLTLASDCVRVAQVAGAKNGLFFRGAVFFGQMTMEDDAIVGIPLLRAARLEAQIIYPVIVIPRNQFSGDDPLPRNPPRIIRLKSGILQAWVILPRPLAKFFKEATAAYHAALIDGPPNVAETWKTLLDELKLWEGETD